MALTILHVTDVHQALDKIEQLKTWLKEKNERIDLILMSGDMATMPMDYDLSQDVIDAYHKDMDAVINSVSSIHATVYYIPGNHDPITSFMKETNLTPPASSPTLPYNVDKRLVYLAPSLCLAGFGGSLPAFLRNGEKVWESYPYKTVGDYNEALRGVSGGLFSQESNILQPTDSLILMTHCGPTDSGTAVDYKDVSNPVESGSEELYRSLKSPKAQQHCVLNLHGHTHACSGKCIIGNITVSNAGSLQEGRFAIYQLCKDPWRLSSLCYYTLPAS